MWQSLNLFLAPSTAFRQRLQFVYESCNDTKDDCHERRLRRLNRLDRRGLLERLLRRLSPDGRRLPGCRQTAALGPIQPG